MKFLMRQPPALKPGVKSISIVSPASHLDEDLFAIGVAKLRRHGHEISVSNALQRRGMLAGSNEARLSELVVAASSSEGAWLLSARGGYGSQLIADGAASAIASSNAILVGYSDLTYIQNLLYFQYRHPSVHGPMLVDFAKAEKYFSCHLLSQLAGGHDVGAEIANYLRIFGVPLRSGTARGSLIGGNLTLLENLIGVCHPPCDRKYVLFIEEVSEAPYRIDRTLNHLRRSGFLDNVAGVLIGEMVDVRDGPTPFGKTVEEIVLDNFPADVPVLAGFPVGHGANNFPVTIGSDVEIYVGMGS